MFITNETILANGPINGWTPTEAKFLGVIEFTSETSEAVVYATPHWDVTGEVPINVVYFNDDEGTIKVFDPISLEGTFEEQLQAYTNRLIEVFRIVETVEGL
jgi:hypothetical protein